MYTDYGYVYPNYITGDIPLDKFNIKFIVVDSMSFEDAKLKVAENIKDDELYVLFCGVENSSAIVSKYFSKNISITKGDLELFGANIKEETERSVLGILDDVLKYVYSRIDELSKKVYEDKSISEEDLAEIRQYIDDVRNEVSDIAKNAIEEKLSEFQDELSKLYDGVFNTKEKLDYVFNNLEELFTQYMPYDKVAEIANILYSKMNSDGKFTVTIVDKTNKEIFVPEVNTVDGAVVINIPDGILSDGCDIKIQADIFEKEKL